MKPAADSGVVVAGAAPDVAPDVAPDRCPRCGGSFHCGAADTAPCPCGGLLLSAALQQRLRQQFTGCLCLACLQALAAADRAAGQALDQATDQAGMTPA